MQQTPALWSASIAGAMSLCIVRVIQLRVGIKMQMSIGAAEVKNRNYPDLNLIENRPKKILYYPIQTRKGWSWIRLTTLTTFQNSKHQMTMRRIHTKGIF